jgi:hypothetical protein
MQRLEHEVRRAVAPRLAQAGCDAAVGHDRDTLEAERRARAVAQEAFEAFAVKGTHRDAGMHVEAGVLDAAQGLLPRARKRSSSS